LPTGHFAYKTFRLWDTSSVDRTFAYWQFACYLDISLKRLFAKYNIGYGIAGLGEKAPAVLFLAAISD